MGEDPAVAEGPVSRMLAGSPALRANSVAHGRTWELNVAGILHLDEEISPEDARCIAGQTTIRQIQFTARPTPNALGLLDEVVLAAHPGARIHTTLNGFGAFEDLGFLDALPHLRRLTVGGNAPIDLTPVRAHGAIRDLGIGGHGTSLLPLTGLQSLESVSWFERLKHVETLTTLPALAALTISGQSLKSLHFLSDAPSLQSLSLAFGGTRAFDALPTLVHLSHLSVWRTRMLDEVHLHPICAATGLRRVHLNELPRVRSLAWLRHAGIDTLEVDLANLASFSTLDGLSGLSRLVVRSRVDATAFGEISRIPSLRRLWLHRFWIDALQAEVVTAAHVSVDAITFREGEPPPEPDA